MRPNVLPKGFVLDPVEPISLPQGFTLDAPPEGFKFDAPEQSAAPPLSATTPPTIESETLQRPSVFLDPVEFLTGAGTGAILSGLAKRPLVEAGREALRAGLGFQTFGLTEAPNLVRRLTRGLIQGFRGQGVPTEAPLLRSAQRPVGLPETSPLLPPEVVPRPTDAPITARFRQEQSVIPGPTPGPGPAQPAAEVIGATPAALPTAPEPPLTLELAESRIIQALKEAKPIRAATERLYSQARSERLGKAIAVGEAIPGEAGFKAQLGQLKGELPKATFEPIRGVLDEDTINTLFTGVRQSPQLSGFEQITAQQGLAKLLGAYGTGVPTKGELALLGRVFSPEFVSTALAKRSLLSKAGDLIAEVISALRTLMVSFDLSAPLRQGVTAIAPFPRQWGRAFMDMFRYAGSEPAYQALIHDIRLRPSFSAMERGGVALTALKGDLLTGREEQFMSRLPERIPLIGRIVRASDRAYTGFLTKLRADAFDELRRRANQSGVEETDALLQSIGRYVNTATGRGTLGQFEVAGGVLSTALFSPRLMASRFNVLSPIYYAKLEPFVRKQALKGALGTVALGMTVLGLAKAAGVGVGSDPRSADFGKIRVGNTRWDVWGGFQQYPRILAQLISGQVVSSTTGDILTLGEGYRPLTRKDIAARFLEMKANPVVGFTLRMLEGRDFDGQPIEITKELRDLVTPMFIQDLADIYKEDPSLLPWVTPGAFGVGIQTYAPKRQSFPFKERK